MIKSREKIFLFLFLLVTTIFLTVICYYSGTRYVGDTALYAQITKNIAYTGKAEGNIFANTQDFIDRSIAAMPVEERLASESAFTPPLEQSRNMLRFHNYLILYLIAPLCYVMPEFLCVTVLQSMALAFSLIFCILIMRGKGVPYPLVIAACILLTAHPGWGMPAVYGAFYPDRLFMGTGLYLTWTCQRERFSKAHFITAIVLCMLVGERGALYAGMFVLAYTIFYWKENRASRRLRLVFGSAAVVYAGVVMKFFLSNRYYSNLGGSLKNFISYVQNPYNQKIVLLFLLINCCFLVAAIMEWKALIIGMASMIPNLLYNVGGAEKIGWTLHYHVFYFVFLMWAVTVGITKLYKMAIQKRTLKTIPYLVAFAVAIMVSIISPADLDISLNLSNLKNNFVVKSVREIRDDYFGGLAEVRRSFNELIDENIPSGSKVSTIEGAMCELSHTDIYIFPMGISSADYAVVAYRKTEEEYYFGGSVVYAGTGEQEVFDRGVVEKMKDYGYDLDNPILFPHYGVAILKRK